MNQGHLAGLITTWMGELRDRKCSQTGRCWEKHFSEREASLEKNNDKAYFSLKHSCGLLPDDNGSPDSFFFFFQKLFSKTTKHEKKQVLYSTKATTVPHGGFYLSSFPVIQVLGWNQSQFDSKDLGPHVFNCSSTWEAFALQPGVYCATA